MEVHDVADMQDLKSVEGIEETNDIHSVDVVEVVDAIEELGDAASPDVAAASPLMLAFRHAYGPWDLGFDMCEGCVGEVLSLGASPDGKFIYLSKHVSGLVVLQVDDKTGLLTQVQVVGLFEGTPEYLVESGRITVSQDGEFVFMNNVDPGVGVWRRDLTSGKLTFAEAIQTTKCSGDALGMWDMSVAYAPGGGCLYVGSQSGISINKRTPSGDPVFSQSEGFLDVHGTWQEICPEESDPTEYVTDAVTDLTVDPSGSLLFAAVNDAEGGRVLAFSLDEDTCDLELLASTVVVAGWWPMGAGVLALPDGSTLLTMGSDSSTVLEYHFDVETASDLYGLKVVDTVGSQEMVTAIGGTVVDGISAPTGKQVFFYATDVGGNTDSAPALIVHAMADDPLSILNFGPPQFLSGFCGAFSSNWGYPWMTFSVLGLGGNGRFLYTAAAGCRAFLGDVQPQPMLFVHELVPVPTP